MKLLIYAHSYVYDQLIILSGDEIANTLYVLS